MNLKALWWCPTFLSCKVVVPKAVTDRVLVGWRYPETLLLTQTNNENAFGSPVPVSGHISPNPRTGSQPGRASPKRSPGPPKSGPMTEEPNQSDVPI